MTKRSISEVELRELCTDKDGNVDEKWLKELAEITDVPDNESDGEAHQTWVEGGDDQMPSAPIFIPMNNNSSTKPATKFRKIDSMSSMTSEAELDDFVPDDSSVYDSDILEEATRKSPAPSFAPLTNSDEAYFNLDEMDSGLPDSRSTDDDNEEKIKPSRTASSSSNSDHHDKEYFKKFLTVLKKILLDKNSALYPIGKFNSRTLSGKISALSEVENVAVIRRIISIAKNPDTIHHVIHLIESIPENDVEAARLICATLASGHIDSFNENSPGLIRELIKDNTLPNISRMQISHGMISREDYSTMKSFCSERGRINHELFKAVTVMQTRHGVPSRANYNSLKKLCTNEGGLIDKGLVQMISHMQAEKGIVKADISKRIIQTFTGEDGKYDIGKFKEELSSFYENGRGKKISKKERKERNVTLSDFLSLKQGNPAVTVAHPHSSSFRSHGNKNSVHELP